MSEPARVSSSLRSRVLDGDPLFVGKVIQQVFYFGQSSVGICLLLVGLCGAGDRRQTTEILRVNVFLCAFHQRTTAGDDSKANRESRLISLLANENQMVVNLFSTNWLSLPPSLTVFFSPPVPSTNTHSS